MPPGGAVAGCGALQAESALDHPARFADAVTGPGREAGADWAWVMAGNWAVTAAVPAAGREVMRMPRRPGSVGEPSHLRRARLARNWTLGL